VDDLESLAAPARSKAEFEIQSPNGKIRARFAVSQAGAAAYSVQCCGEKVLGPSRLGIIREDGGFCSGLKLESASDPCLVDETYALAFGKRKLCRYRANERIFRLENAEKGRMEIIFRVSDDGVAFRYSFPEKSDAPRRIARELTTFHFPAETRAWLHHCPDSKEGWCQTQPSYEEHYRMGMAVGARAPFQAGWVMPGLFLSGTHWLTLTETGLDRSHCGSRLSQDSPDGEYGIQYPQATENFPGGGVVPESRLPWRSPWRIIGVGDSLSAIAESTLGTDLADPAAYDASAYARPGRASWSWVILKDEETVFGTQKEFVDFAADMRWEYCLVDATWDARIGYDRIRELAGYARGKGVGLLLWYNSAGPWNSTPFSPRDRLLTPESRTREFSVLKEMGVSGIKVDFFGGDGRSMIEYYLDILADAHRFGLMVNFHGSTYPRGWQRTYPNLMNMEGVRGFEYITFDQANADAAPSHCCVLPFTRNLYDAMDFTPMNFSGIPNILRRTTVGFELATAVAFIAGIQHFAEIPSGMAAVPEELRELLRGLPSAWDETVFIDGFPGKLVILARRAGDRWFVAGMNGENATKALEFDLPVACRGRAGRWFADGDGPGVFDLRSLPPGPGTGLEAELKPFGGFVLVI
jgi:hypothetical protein